MDGVGEGNGREPIAGGFVRIRTEVGRPEGIVGGVGEGEGEVVGGVGGGDK